MNLIINIFLLILIIIIFYESYIQKKNENFQSDEAIYTTVAQKTTVNQNDINFMFYQGTKPKGMAITSKPELKNNINDLVNYALTLKNCSSFTNDGDFYENFDLCYDKGPLNTIKGEPSDGTYIKSQIFENYLINIC